MSVQSVKISFPSPMARPRSADRSPVLRAWLARIGRSVWQGFEAIGQARANSELERLARQHAHSPELAQSFRDAMRRDASAPRGIS